MAQFTCKNHPTLRWHCKDEAVSDTGKYTGARNIFFSGDAAHPDYADIKRFVGTECTCSPSDLVLVDPTDLARIIEYNKPRY